ncbi:sigma-70 family RNA polymerase sigma factor [Kiritimatiellaeota bacterium B1221]|nr:sigma-70 family RNA polymerase sigma factor [Kiritimatiellaeota bacterium B1221]
MEEHNLETLLQHYREGDQAALGRIVDQTRVPLYRFIYGLVRDPHVAEDVFQDVWIRAIKGLHRYQSDRLLAWLFRIARNRVIDLSRKRKPDYSLQQPVASPEQSGSTLETFIPHKDRGPGQHTQNHELALRIQDAVDKLPLEQREVYLMRTEADLPFKVIAQTQNVSINTALARMQYALRSLRELLADDYEALLTQSRTS